MATDFDTVAGSQLFVCEDAPSAQTAVAFAELAWVKVGKISNVGGVVGRTYSTSTMSFVDESQEIEKKGTFKLPNAQFECGWVEDDAGQMIIDAASRDHSIPSFKLVKQNGDIRYFTAQVLEFLENNGTGNDAVKGNFTLLRQTDTIKA
ncbi:hypothetical protein [Massilia sp. DD77]|uniref:hypothetical protein n=1 Tax=Massilia sp. DD77 TaxID=3109349 RepID=UPI002FFFF37E